MHPAASGHIAWQQELGSESVLHNIGRMTAAARRPSLTILYCLVSHMQHHQYCKILS